MDNWGQESSKKSAGADEGALLQRFGKTLTRGSGKTLGWFGTLVAVAGVAAFGIAVAVPALGALMGGAPLLLLLGKVAATLPYFGAIVGGGVAAMAGGYGLARVGGETFAEEASPYSGASCGTNEKTGGVGALDDVSSKFNGSSPRTAAAEPQFDAVTPLLALQAIHHLQ